MLYDQTSLPNKGCDVQHTLAHYGDRGHDVGADSGVVGFGQVDERVC